MVVLHLKHFDVGRIELFESTLSLVTFDIESLI